MRHWMNKFDEIQERMPVNARVGGLEWDPSKMGHKALPDSDLLQTHSAYEETLLAGLQVSTMTSFSDYYYLNTEK